MLSAEVKSSGLADIQVEMKKSAHADYGSCYYVGHCEPSSLSLTLRADASVCVLFEMQHGAHLSEQSKNTRPPQSSFYCEICDTIYIY